MPYDSSYPIPSYAATIWIVGDEIKLCLPPVVEGARAHTVTLKNNQSGLQALSMVLKDRARAEHQSRAIGTKAAPVQYDIDKMMLAMNIQKLAPQYKTEAKPDLKLEDLDL